jgi:hypothetical protein
MGKAHAQALTFPASAMGACHIGGGPCFIDKDQALWVKIKLALEPPTPRRQYIGPILLYRVASLFLRVKPMLAKKRSKLDLLVCTPFSASAINTQDQIAISVQN